MAKNAQPIMFATRSGTIVCVSNVATKKIAPTRANILASVMLCRKISSRRLKMASQVTLFGSRPIWTRIFANLRLSVAASRMRSSMMDISPLEPVRPAYRKWLYRSATNLAARLPRWVIFNGFSGGCLLGNVSFVPKPPKQGQGVAFGRTPVIQAPKLRARIMRYELADYEWVAIKPMLPDKPRGVPRVNDRRVLNGIFWASRSGVHDTI